MFDEARRVHEDHAVADQYLAYIYASAGQRDEAIRVLGQLTQESMKSELPTIAIALPYVALGEHAQAFQWLDKAYEDRTWDLPYVNVDPAYDPLRDDPRFQDLLRRMNFPD